MDVFAFRPAPVQATWLDSGDDHFIDHVGDRIVTSIEHADHFSERIAQLPCQPNDYSRPLPPCPPRTELGLPEDAVVLCCFNQTYKPAQSRILAAPRAVLWMLARESARVLRRELLARRRAGARVLRAQARPARRSPQARADSSSSDTWPSAPRRHCQRGALGGSARPDRAGTPSSSRVAASLVAACGLPDLACADEAHYVGLVAALANEAATLAGLKSHLQTN